MDPKAFTTELDTHRRYLLRVAQLQLRDPDLAEDVVQDTLVAALGAQSGFTGKSSLKTWLTGILKHKIVDAIRQKQRRPIIEASFDEETELDDFDPLFKDNGAWVAPPAEWGDPENALSRRQFFDVMEICLEKLPPNTARVFVMREVMELESDEICKELTITANNLWVILYRARMALRNAWSRTGLRARGAPSSTSPRRCVNPDEIDQLPVGTLAVVQRGDSRCFSGAGSVAVGVRTLETQNAPRGLCEMHAVRAADPIHARSAAPLPVMKRSDIVSRTDSTHERHR